MQLVTDEALSMNAETHQFKIVVFERLTVQGKDVIAENEILHLMADIVVEQVD